MPFQSARIPGFPRTLGTMALCGLLGIASLPAVAELDAPIPRFSEPVEAKGLVSDEWVARKVTYPAETAGADLVVTLDQQMHGSLMPLIKEFATERKVKVAVNGGTCGTTSGALQKKEADIGGYCCPPAANDRLPGLKYHTLGIAGLAFFVNPNNPVSDVSLDEARGLFSGDILSWDKLQDPAVRSHPKDVRLITHIHCKLRPGHWKLLLPTEDMFSPDIEDLTAAPDLLHQVAVDTDAIGFETLAMQRLHADQGKLRELTLNGIAAGDLNALAEGRYPLYRVFNLTTWEGNPSNELANQLVDYLLAEVEKNQGDLFVAPASLLKENGWKFHGNEVVGEPRASS